MSKTDTPQTTATISQGYDPEPTDVLRDSRTDELLQILYVDAHVVFLRGEVSSRGNDYSHRMDLRGDFDSQIDRGRLKPAPDTEIDVPVPNLPAPTPSGSTAPTPDQPDPSQSMPAGDGESAGDDEADDDRDIDEAKRTHHTLDSLSDQATSIDTGEKTTEDADSDTPDTGCNDREQWSDIAHIGEKTESNLYDAGYETVVDIQSADREQLQTVPQLGNAGITNLFEYVGDQ